MPPIDGIPHLPQPRLKSYQQRDVARKKHVHAVRWSRFRNVTCFNKTLSLSPPISPPTHHLPSQFGGDQSAGLTAQIVLLRSFLPRSASAVRGFDETAGVVYVFFSTSVFVVVVVVVT